MHDLISRLHEAESAERSLDLSIAVLIGYRRHVESAEDQSRRVTWFFPTGEPANSIPYFTASIDDARMLAEAICPGHVGACSWEPGMASARIIDGEYIQASTPAIALCIAALTELSKRRSGA